MHPRNFNFEPDDSPIVRIFKKNKIYMWFREPCDDPNATINNLPLIQ